MKAPFAPTFTHTAAIGAAASTPAPWTDEPPTGLFTISVKASVATLIWVGGPDITDASTYIWELAAGEWARWTVTPDSGYFITQRVGAVDGVLTWYIEGSNV